MTSITLFSAITGLIFGAIIGLMEGLHSLRTRKLRDELAYKEGQIKALRRQLEEKS